MIKAREYSFQQPSTLYHYCSPETFLIICQTKRLRYSDLYGMNDFLERRWGLDMFSRIAATFETAMGEQFVKTMVEAVQGFGAIVCPLAACFSKDGDVLSQWRAYSQDGAGYAIGFDAQKIAHMPARTVNVEYDAQVQHNEIRQHIQSLFDEFGRADIEKEYKLAFRTACSHFANDLAAYKNPAFKEENEVRQLHVISHSLHGESIKLEDSGGVAFTKPYVDQPISFVMKRGIPVPFLDIDFSDDGALNPIREVIIGPRNPAPELAVMRMLETLNIPSVIVRKSSASYQ
ncbi:DUF2971 domain-containing protein [Herbaspirillum sp. NPDC101396]|uniref:DUF2971 domain-containing protein n=1 Tax=Herbaspirillum sp. NPDC101396 TaxID=3364005 RepID=UPI00383A579C